MNPGLPTLYEELAGLGLTSGSVNGLVYRGNTNHTLIFPPYIYAFTSLPKEVNVRGPDLLCFGAFTQSFLEDKGLPDGVSGKFGFNNDYVVETVTRLVRTGQMPDFLYVYLPDLDKRLHRKGPPDLEGVIRLDGHIHSMLEAFGSKEQALNEAIIMLIGDSGVSSIVSAGEEPVIELPSLFKEFQVLHPGTKVSAATELVLAVNETMAYVYTLKNEAESSLRTIAQLLKAESRIDTSLPGNKTNGFTCCESGQPTNSVFDRTGIESTRIINPGQSGGIWGF